METGRRILDGPHSNDEGSFTEATETPPVISAFSSLPLDLAQPRKLCCHLEQTANGPKRAWGALWNDSLGVNVDCGRHAYQLLTVLQRTSMSDHLVEYR